MSRSRTTSVTYIEEEVEVKPAIELVADEYEELEGIHVHVFVDDRETFRNVGLLLETFAKLGFVCGADKVHYLGEIRSDDCEVLAQIRNDCDGLNGIIFFFFGVCRYEGYIEMNGGAKKLEDIWNMFNADQCPALKNKPKIFIFRIEQLVAVARDGIRVVRVPYEIVYDTPAEADILIVYKRVEDGETEEFIETVCRNIETFGDSEDIVSILCYLTTDPGLAISTMTRKFYFAPSESRGISNVIEKINVQIKHELTVWRGPAKSHGRIWTLKTNSSAGSSRRSTPGAAAKSVGTVTTDSSGRSVGAKRKTVESDGKGGKSPNDSKPPWRY